MGKYDSDVKEILGSDVLKLICKHVTKYVTDLSVMNDIAGLISEGIYGGNNDGKVFGNQQRRKGFDVQAMMRDILISTVNIKCPLFCPFFL